MEKPEIVRYGDGYYRRTIYGLGPYIADYPEQVLLACIVQGWCPRYALTYLTTGMISDLDFNCVDVMRGGMISTTLLAQAVGHIV
jgi:hypothetical protein